MDDEKILKAIAEKYPNGFPVTDPDEGDYICLTEKEVVGIYRLADEQARASAVIEWLESEEAAREICLAVRVPYKPRLIKRLHELAARMKKED